MMSLHIPYATCSLALPMMSKSMLSMMLARAAPSLDKEPHVSVARAFIMVPLGSGEERKGLKMYFCHFPSVFAVYLNVTNLETYNVGYDKFCVKWTPHRAATSYRIKLNPLDRKSERHVFGTTNSVKLPVYQMSQHKTVTSESFLKCVQCRFQPPFSYVSVHWNAIV